MANTLREPEAGERDGTSQSGRALAALDPGYVAVDERTTEDHVAFAREYGKELTYFGPDNQPAGDWSGFIGSLSPTMAAAFLSDPSTLSPATAPDFFRSHFTLFLTFLGLLDKARGEMNQLTARHLEFYYQQVLRLGRRRSIPDHVNVIVDLAADGKEVLLPAGSLLQAGPDSLGKDRVYATDRDLVVNRTQISRLSSLYVDRRRTSLHGVKSRYPNDKERAVEAVLSIGLGDPLPPYPDGTQVNFAKLTTLRAYLARAETDFFVPIPAMRDLMVRFGLRPPAPAEWDGINAKLEIAGTNKRGGTPFHLDHSSRNFDANLTLAVGTLDFSTLPQVANLDDVYDLRGRSDVQAFIQRALYFPNVDDFAQMMQLKRKFTTEWNEINRLLQVAGQTKRNDPNYTLVPADVTDFATNVQAAIGTTSAALQSYWNGVTMLEGYFYMQAERFAFAVDEVVSDDENDWDQTLSIVEDAYRERLRKQRRDALKALHEATPPGRLVDLIRYVLGEDPDTTDDPTAPDRLVPYLGQADTDKLSQLAQDGNWDRIYSLLEVAQRNRLGEPPPEKVEWMNVYPASDATAVQSHAGLQGSSASDVQHWLPFGTAQPAANPTPVPAPVIGWALSSPLLVLGEGTRTITLTLGFGPTTRSLQDLLSTSTGELPLQFELSTAKGYVVCTAAAPTFGTYASLSAGNTKGNPQGVQFVLTLAPGVAPIAALPPEQSPVGSPWPTLRLMMKPIWDLNEKQHLADYPELAQLNLIAAYIKVDVSGLKSLQLQNDDGALDPKRPFEPFGSTPAIGSHFLLGHPELVAKDLTSLTFNFVWMGAPPSLNAYYANYGLPDSTIWTTKVSWIDRFGEKPLATAAPLFATSGADPVTLRVTGSLQANDATDPAPLAASSAAQAQDLQGWSRYLQWELNSPDFQHANYPAVASAKALALTIDSVKSPATLDPTKYQVKPPYTPKLKSLTIGYSSALELRFDDLNRDASIHRVYHIHPFGVCDVEAERTAQGLPLLPRLQYDGELYLGLRDLVPPQTVAIFFQVAEGSADPDLTPETIKWSYLSGDRWLPLDSQVRLDTTRNLSNSGIVELSLPPADPSTRMPVGPYWVRMAITQDTTSVCELVGVHTQAVSATFVDHDNAPDHFSQPLPASTITKLYSAIPAIAGIRQPYTSYGGRTAEAADTWATRVSERLRHKDRALAIWDYERILLDRFPELHKVKCIPARPEDPGRIVVIVVPNVRNKVPFEPFEPKAPANLLMDVQDYLAARTPASATVEVRNPRFVAVRVRLGVRFRGSGNEEFYKQQLSDELNRFLSPWAYDEGAEIAIGGRIYASTIVDFVDRRPYVDYVAGIKLFSSDDGEGFRPVARPPAGNSEGYFVGTQAPDVILVAARSHQIDVLSDAMYEEKLVTGINFMKLELDFIVAEG